MNAQIRQGDVWLERVARIPQSAKPQPRCVLALGELSGHAHEIDDREAVLFLDGDDRYIEVIAEFAVVKHTGAPVGDHGPHAIPRGFYRQTVQREYWGEEERDVFD